MILTCVFCSGLAWCRVEAARQSPTALVPPACPGHGGEQCTSPSWRVRNKVEIVQKCMTVTQVELLLGEPSLQSLRQSHVGPPPSSSQTKQIHMEENIDHSHLESIY